MPVRQARAEQEASNRRQGESRMTQIISGTRTECASDPAILELLPTQGSVELQRDAAGKVHHFHTHPVDEILVIIKGALKFELSLIHISEPTRQAEISYAVFCLKKK